MQTEKPEQPKTIIVRGPPNRSSPAKSVKSPPPTPTDDDKPRINPLKIERLRQELRDACKSHIKVFLSSQAEHPEEEILGEAEIRAAVIQEIDDGFFTQIRQGKDPETLMDQFPNLSNAWAGDLYGESGLDGIELMVADMKSS